MKNQNQKKKTGSNRNPELPEESGSANNRETDNQFRLPLYLNLLRPTDETKQDSRFKIEDIMLTNRVMAPSLSGSLSEWIKRTETLAASEKTNVFTLASSGKLPGPFFPPILKPNVWLAAWRLTPGALAEVNAVYPGAIYTEPKFVKMMREMTFLAANGDLPEKRNTANNWLRTVFAVPPPPRKQPRKSKRKSGRQPRSPEIHLSSIHIWIIQQLYMNIVAVRTLYKKLKRHSTSRENTVEELLRRMPELHHVKDRKPAWFDMIISARPYPLDTTCEILASIPESGLQGYKPESICKAYERRSRNAKLNLTPILKRFAQDQGSELSAEPDNRDSEISSSINR